VDGGWTRQAAVNPPSRVFVPTAQNIDVLKELDAVSCAIGTKPQNRHEVMKQNGGHAVRYIGGHLLERKTIPVEWLEEFEAASKRPLSVRMRYAFIRTYKPVMDDEPYRSFESMAEYRAWCEANLPSWLGYGRV